MRKPLVIALSGWKRSGKDLTADFLINEFGFKRYSFADLLKDMVSRDYNVARDLLDDNKFKEMPLLDKPVEPKDGFTKTIANLLFLEFKTKEGNKSKYNDFTTSQLHLEQLFWTPRSLAILMGSTNRAVASDYWVKAVLNKAYLNGDHAIVITDLRYKSELSQLREQFGDNLITIRINRFDSSPSNDPSERDLDHAEFDYIVDNKETILVLQDKIARLVEKEVITRNAL